MAVIIEKKTLSDSVDRQFNADVSGYLGELAQAALNGREQKVDLMVGDSPVEFKTVKTGSRSSVLHNGLNFLKNSFESGITHQRGDVIESTMSELDVNLPNVQYARAFTTVKPNQSSKRSRVDITYENGAGNSFIDSSLKRVAGQLSNGLEQSVANAIVPSPIGGAIEYSTLTRYLNDPIFPLYAEQDFSDALPVDTKGDWATNLVRPVVGYAGNATPDNARSGFANNTKLPNIDAVFSSQMFPLETFAIEANTNKFAMETLGTSGLSLASIIDKGLMLAMMKIEQNIILKGSATLQGYGNIQSQNTNSAVLTQGALSQLTQDKFFEAAAKMWKTAWDSSNRTVAPNILAMSYDEWTRLQSIPVTNVYGGSGIEVASRLAWLENYFDKFARENVAMGIRTLSNGKTFRVMPLNQVADTAMYLYYADVDNGVSQTQPIAPTLYSQMGFDGIHFVSLAFMRHGGIKIMRPTLFTAFTYTAPNP